MVLPRKGCSIEEAEKQKERVAVALITNAVSDKVGVVAVLKSAQPRCFKPMNIAWQPSSSVLQSIKGIDD